MYKKKLFKVIGAVVAIAFFVTNSAYAAPADADTLRALSFKNAPAQLSESIGTHLSLGIDAKEHTPEDEAVQLAQLTRLLTTSKDEDIKRMVRQALIGKLGGKIQQALSNLIHYRDMQYLTAVGSTGTAGAINAPEVLFTPGHDAYETMRNTHKALIAVNIVGFNQMLGHMLAAMEKNAGIIFEVARSQLDYAIDEHKTVAYIKEVAERIGFDRPLILHGDHIQYEEKLFNVRAILKEEYEKVHGKGSYKDGIDIEQIDVGILNAVQQRLRDNAEKERKVIEGYIERLIKAGFTSIAIDASTIFDEVAGDTVLDYYREHGTPAERLVVELEEGFELSLEWGADFLKLDPDSEVGRMRFEYVKNTVVSNMEKRNRGKDEIDAVVKDMTSAFGVLHKKARDLRLPASEVIIVYDGIMREVAAATIAGKLSNKVLDNMSKKQKLLLLPTSNAEETAHQLAYIDKLVKKHTPKLEGHFGKEIEVGHVDKKVPNPRRGGKLEPKMTHPAAVRVMGEHLSGLSFDLIATNNGSGHGTDYGKETLNPISQVGKISPWLTEELQREAEKFNAAIVQHGTSGSDMEELADLAGVRVIKFNIATNYQQIILNILSLMDDGLTPDEILQRRQADAEALVEGLHKRTREKIRRWAEAFAKDPSTAELKDDDTLFVEMIKRAYAWGIKKKKIKEASTKEDISILLAKEFKRAFSEMNEKLYALGHSDPIMKAAIGETAAKSSPAGTESFIEQRDKLSVYINQANLSIGRLTPGEVLSILQFMDEKGHMPIGAFDQGTFIEWTDGNKENPTQADINKATIFRLQLLYYYVANVMKKYNRKIGALIDRPALEALNDVGAEEVRVSTLIKNGAFPADFLEVVKGIPVVAQMEETRGKRGVIKTADGTVEYYTAKRRDGFTVEQAALLGAKMIKSNVFLYCGSSLTGQEDEFNKRQWEFIEELAKECRQFDIAYVSEILFMKSEAAKKAPEHNYLHEHAHATLDAAKRTKQIEGITFAKLAHPFPEETGWKEIEPSMRQSYLKKLAEIGMPWFILSAGEGWETFNKKVQEAVEYGGIVGMLIGRTPIKNVVTKVDVGGGKTKTLLKPTEQVIEVLQGEAVEKMQELGGYLDSSVNTVWQACGVSKPAVNKLQEIQNAISGTKTFPVSEEPATARTLPTAKLINILSHEAAVSSAAFSPDGTQIVTASSDKTARIWDAKTGKCISILNHADAVRSAAFSPDSRKLVTATLDNTARIWDVETGQCINILEGRTRTDFSAAFSPDGKKLITRSDDKTARIWDAETGQCINILNHADAVCSVAFSPDGTRIVTASIDNTARIWDAKTGQCIHILKGHTGAVSSTAFSPDGTRILTASSSWDATARIWDVETGKCINILEGHTGGVCSVAFSPDGARIVTASIDNTARIWDAKTGQCIHILEGHIDAVRSAAFSPDGTRIVTTSDDRTAGIWDAKTGKGNILRHTDVVSSAAFSPDGRKLVTACWDKTAYLWKLSESANTGIPPAKTSPATTDSPKVLIHENREVMGDEASKQVWDIMLKLLKTTDRKVSAVLASAPSQVEFLAGLAKKMNTAYRNGEVTLEELGRINIFHMDQYVGLHNKPKEYWEKCDFAIFLEKNFSSLLVDEIKQKIAFHPIRQVGKGLEGDALLQAAQQECARYLKEEIEPVTGKDGKIDIVVFGIGDENGHLAFIEPENANIADTKALIPVKVAPKQQVSDGMFRKTEDVPEWAISMTLHRLILGSDYMVGVIPAPSKAVSTRNMLEGPIGPECPSSFVRLKESSLVTVNLTKDSAKHLSNQNVLKASPDTSIKAFSAIPENHKIVPVGEEKFLIVNVGSTSVKMELQDAQGNLLAEGKTKGNIGDKECLFYAGVTEKGAMLIMQREDLRIGKTRERVRETIFWAARQPNDYIVLCDVKEHKDALVAFVNFINPWAGIQAVFYKTVYGGPNREGVFVLDEDTLTAMGETYIKLAPVHNYYYTLAARTLKQLLPNTIHLGRFETATHIKNTPESTTTSLPYRVADALGLKAVGFHGASFAYLLKRIPEVLTAAEKKLPENLKVIVFHIGGSSSVCMAENGVSLETSMMGTPESGFTQGDRITGANVNPQMVEYIVEALTKLCIKYYSVEITKLYTEQAYHIRYPDELKSLVDEMVTELVEKGTIREKPINYEKEDLSLPPRFLTVVRGFVTDVIRQRVNRMLVEESGLAGIAGIGTGDLEKILEAADRGNEMAQLAYKVLVAEAKHYLGAYIMKLGGEVNVIAFTAGTGENCARFRKDVIGDGKFFGWEVIKLDNELNERTVKGKEGIISSLDSRVVVMVIKANEAATLVEECLAKYRQIIAESSQGSAKTSPARTDSWGISPLMQELDTELSSFLSIEPALLKWGSMDSLKSKLRDTRFSFENLKQTLPASAAFIAEHLTRINNLSWALDMSKEVAALSDELDDMQAVKEAELETTGTVILNEQDIPQEQRAIIDLLRKSSPYRAEFIKQLGANVVLAGEYDPQTDRTPHMIVVSKTKLAGLEDAKYLDVTSIAGAEVFLPVVYEIVFAKGLLLYSITKSALVKGSLSRLYRKLARIPLKDELLNEFINTSVFKLLLPKPEAIDKQYFDELQRVSLQALIAA